jgi:hypothetical protein
VEQAFNMSVVAASTTVRSVAFKLVVVGPPGSPVQEETPTQQDTQAVLALARLVVCGLVGLVGQVTAGHTVLPCMDIEVVWQLDQEAESLLVELAPE